MRDRRLQAIRLNAGIVAKIIFAIVWKVQGTFEPGIGWLILMLAVSLVLAWVLHKAVDLIISKAPPQPSRRVGG